MNFLESPARVLTEEGYRYDIFGEQTKDDFTTGTAILVNRPTDQALTQGVYVPPYFSCVKYDEPPSEIKGTSYLAPQGEYTGFSSFGDQAKVPSWANGNAGEGRFWIEGGKNQDGDQPKGFEDLFGGAVNQTQNAVTADTFSVALPPATQDAIQYKSAYAQPGFTQTAQGPVPSKIPVTDSMKVNL